jgi:molybdopterin-guanine dinucleotide biosynthesis protein A
MLGVRLALGAHPSVRAFLEEIDAAQVRFSDPAPFRNANTREALAVLEAEIAQKIA